MEEVFDWPRVVTAATSKISQILKLGSGSNQPRSLAALAPEVLPIRGLLVALVLAGLLGWGLLLLDLRPRRHKLRHSLDLSHKRARKLLG